MEDRDADRGKRRAEPDGARADHRPIGGDRRDEPSRGRPSTPKEIPEAQPSRKRDRAEAAAVEREWRPRGPTGPDGQPVSAFVPVPVATHTGQVANPFAPQGAGGPAPPHTGPDGQPVSAFPPPQPRAPSPDSEEADKKRRRAEAKAAMKAKIDQEIARRVQEEVRRALAVRRPQAKKDKRKVDKSNDKENAEDVDKNDQDEDKETREEVDVDQAESSAARREGQDEENQADNEGHGESGTSEASLESAGSAQTGATVPSDEGEDRDLR